MKGIFKEILALYIVFAICVLAFIALAPHKAHSSPRIASAIERLNGLHERKNNRRLRKVLGVNPARVPWCGYAVAFAVRRAGKRPPKGYPSAGSWRRWCRRVGVRNLRRGDVVLRRSRYSRSGYHVGVVKKATRKGVVVCSGNSSNRVKCSYWGRIHSGRRR